MKKPYVVLRREGAAPSGVSVELDEFTSSKLPDVLGHAEVLAAAPAVPTTPILPLSAGPAAGNAHVVDWGIRAVGADRSPYSGAGVTVAVLDSGICRSFPCFSGVAIVERNFSDDAADGDLTGHGTHSAAKIFGRDVDGARVGVARGVTKALAGKVIGARRVSSEALANAISWAAREGAHVISISATLDFPAYVEDLVEGDGFPRPIATAMALDTYRLNLHLFETLIDTVSAQPLVVVAAAGNQSRADVDLRFRVAVAPPAVAHNVVSVAALQQDPGDGRLFLASFSNIGASIAAPGVGIRSVDRIGQLALFSGTSTAAPHVAGVAALWYEKLAAAGPVTSAMLRAQLLHSAITEPFKPGLGRAEVGAGLITAPRE